MSKLISIAFALAVIGCATGNKASQAPSASAPQTVAPPAFRLPQLQVTYSIADPGEGWKVYQNVTLSTGESAIFVVQHKTDGKPDGVILVISKPAAMGSPKAAATLMRDGDDKLGAIVSDVTCSKEKSPLRCEYQGVGKGTAGPINMRAVFRSMDASIGTAAIVGLWPPDLEGPMLKTYDAVVASLTVTIKK